jgi:hypothetical protein
VSVELVAGLISGVTVVFLVLLLIIFFLCFRDRYRDPWYLFLRRLQEIETIGIYFSVVFRR